MIDLPPPEDIRFPYDGNPSKETTHISCSDVNVDTYDTGYLIIVRIILIILAMIEVDNYDITDDVHCGVRHAIYRYCTICKFNIVGGDVDDIVTNGDK